MVVEEANMYDEIEIDSSNIQLENINNLFDKGYDDMINCRENLYKSTLK